MSSESDGELFYDAEEDTSNSQTQFFSPMTTIHHEQIEVAAELKCLASAEEQLLERQRLAEERRRKEDEDMQVRLNEIQERKEVEEEKQVVLRKAAETEKRKKRLDEARMQMADETTPNRIAPPKPPRLHLQDTDDSRVTTSLSDSLLAENTKQTQAVTLASDQLGTVLDTAPPIQELNQGLPNENVVSEQLVCRVNDRHNVVKSRDLPLHSEKVLVPDEPVAGFTGVNLDCQQDSINLHKQNVAIEKCESKHILEELQCDNDNSKESVPIFSQLSSQEPDIVQSTRSLPRDLPPPPVAPPRRKKRNKAIQPPSDLKLDSASEASEDSQSRGLPADAETPTSAVYCLTEELEKTLGLEGTIQEQSLDLCAATKGNRKVTAVEEQCSKGDNTQLEEETEKDDQVDGECEQELEQKKKDGGLPEMRNKGETKQDKSGSWPKRPRSNSGSRYLTDQEILDRVSVLNLDTGEAVPLSHAEDKLPKAVNPLSLHIMRRTKEYLSDSSLDKHKQSDEDEPKDGSPPKAQSVKTIKRIKAKRRQLKKLFGKTVNKIKSVADDVFHGEESGSDDDEIFDGRRMIKVKASHSHKGPYDFDLLVPVQDLMGEHTGAVWTMKFSHCGKLLATGGQDNLLRVWVLKDAYSYFEEMRHKYSEAAKVSPAPSQESLNSQPESHSETSSLGDEQDSVEMFGDEDEDDHAPFRKKPFCVYRGHTGDILDVSWSKNYFFLSSSMDKTVRLWHVYRKECLCCFQHIDFVTAITFHPKDDRYFLSGSLDGKLRLWSIPDKKVELWNEVSGNTKLITAANFCLGGRFAVVGTYDGRCIFYSTDHMKYFTQIHVRSTRGKNSRGRKITGVEPFPGEDKILVTSNDSRIRLYDLRDLTLTSKYKGCVNNSSQIKASFSSNGKYIICGSEDHFVYIWRTQHEFYRLISSARRDRNDYWEGIRAHGAVVTTAVFAPNPKLIIKEQFQQTDACDKDDIPTVRGEVLISADYTGVIRIFINKFKPGSG